MNLRFVHRPLLMLAILAAGNAAHAQDTRAVGHEELEALTTANLVTVILEGAVHSPDGTPAVGAVVVSTAGGQAVTDEHGEYRLETRVACEANRLQVTAVGGTGGKLVASTQVTLTGVAASASVPSMQLSQSSGCNASWLPTFGGLPGTEDEVFALTVFDDGNGPELIVGGRFSVAGGLPVRFVAKWDGSEWASLGTELNAFVRDLIVFDDGNGERLYAGGDFLSFGVPNPILHVAKWDGSAWVAVGHGTNQTVYALEVFDDGNGERLIASGGFTTAGGVPIDRIASWDGSSWSSLGAGLSGAGFALTTFDDGSGPALIAGGNFPAAGGVAAAGIAKWDGSSWTAFGGGIGSTVRALAVFDEGNGDRLFAGGSFTVANGAPANRVTKWNGSSWVAVGSGMDEEVRALAVFDDGNGNELFAGGEFETAGGVAAKGIAKWDGSSWASVGGGVSASFVGYPGILNTLAVFDDGSGAVLCAAGRFNIAGNVGAGQLANWNGSTWGVYGMGLDNAVYALAVFDDGNGERLYVGGHFRTPGGVATNYIAKWDGTGWVSLAGGMDEPVRALKVFDDGNGERLFAGGEFTTAGGVPANRIAKWDGVAWAPLGSGTDGKVTALSVFDDGNGSHLVVGGDFTNAGGSLANYIAKWDGSTWAELDGGLSGAFSATVNSLLVFDDGNGEALIVGGEFTAAGGAPAAYVARWDGVAWSALGAGTVYRVHALTVFDDGNGAALIAGGDWSQGAAVARWDGADWTSLGTGLGQIRALTVFDDGNGERLYAGGVAGTTGPSAQLAMWDGVTWQPLGNGVNRYGVYALEVFDDGAGDALYVGGAFSSAPDSGDSYLAKWGCISSPPSGFNSELCNGDGGDQMGCTDCPCSNNAPAGTVGGCLNSALSATCILVSGDPVVSLPSGAASDLRFAVIGAPQNAFCILNSGEALAPTNPANPCFGLGSGVPAMPFDGLRCAVMNTRRHGGRSADSNGEVGVTNSPWGGEGAPPAGIAGAGAGFAAGQVRFFQVIHRDDPLAQCMSGLNSSQAIEVVFEP